MPIAVSRIVAPITPRVSSDAAAVMRYVPSPYCSEATHSPITARRHGIRRTDLQAREQWTQRRRQLDRQERARPLGTHHACKVEEVPIDAGEAVEDVDDDREEEPSCDDDELRDEAEAEQDRERRRTATTGTACDVIRAG